MLSNFIRRGGKRKGNKTNESPSHQKSPSSSSNLVSPRAYNAPSPAVVQSSQLVVLDLSHPTGEWFPKELLGSRSVSPESTSRPSPNAVPPQNMSAQDGQAGTSPEPTSPLSDNVSSVVTFRKKSIPAPILIPDANLLKPNIQIGHSAVPTGVLHSVKSLPLPNATEAALSPASPSASDNLSAISGTTLARALIASSFVLSTNEHRSSRHRSGVVRQDSATLPHGETFFLSDSDGSSPIPPVPPVPAKLIGAPSNTNQLTPVKSGASTDSEYPMTDSNSVISRRMSRAHENPLSPASSSNTASPVALPDTTSQRKADSVPGRTRVVRNGGVFDVPRTAVEPIHSQESQYSSLEGSFGPSSADHSLDEFDFLPPVLIGSPDSDSSLSSPVPIKRGNTTRGQRRRKPVGPNLTRNASKDSTLAPQQGGLPSATPSENDYGELLNYELTISPGSHTPLNVASGTSAGYQTFPETPMVFSPLWSPGFALLARSDSQTTRKRPSSPKSAGRGVGKLYNSLRVTKHGNGGVDGVGALRKSQSVLVKPSSPKQVISNLSTPEEVSEEAEITEDSKQSPTMGAEESQEPEESAELRSALRPHPLSHVSSSSSCLPEEEALRALAKRSSSSMPDVIIGDIEAFANSMLPASDTESSIESPVSAPYAETTIESPASVPQSSVESPFSSPASADSGTAVSSSTSPLQSSLPTSATAVSPSHPSKSPLSPFFGGSSFLPSPSPPGSRPLSPVPVIVSSATAEELISHSPSPSFVPPPPYHSIISERTAHHPGSSNTPSLSRRPSADPGFERSRQPSNSSLASVTLRSRIRSRPPLPIGPRKPSAPGQPVLNSFVPGVRGRNGSTSSIGSNASGSPGSLWRKLQSAVSKPPKFQTPPPKWRGLTLEAAQWTFTSEQLQEMVSQAIQQSSESSSLRLLRLEVLDGEIADEAHRLELQHTDVKAQYKALVRKRWTLMGALVGHIEGMEMNDTATAARTMEELADVMLALDQLTERMHDIVLELAQLKSLRDVHNASALAMAVRKMNGLCVRQMTEKERLQEQVDALQTERDEAWKHAEDIAQDYDTLNDRVSENACTCGDRRSVDMQSLPGTSSKRSTRISAVRKSSVRQSQAGLRSRSRRRSGRSSTAGHATRPSSLTLEDIPPVPPLRMNTLSTSSGILSLPTGTSTRYSSNSGFSEALALAEAQREVYEMLGLSLPPSQASEWPRRRTVSASGSRPRSLGSRPASETLDVRPPRLYDDNRKRSIRSVLEAQEA